MRKTQTESQLLYLQLCNIWQVMQIFQVSTFSYVFNVGSNMYISYSAYCLSAEYLKKKTRKLFLGNIAIQNVIPVKSKRNNKKRTPYIRYFLLPPFFLSYLPFFKDWHIDPRIRIWDVNVNFKIKWLHLIGGWFVSPTTMHSFPCMQNERSRCAFECWVLWGENMKL